MRSINVLLTYLLYGQDAGTVTLNEQQLIWANALSQSREPRSEIRCLRVLDTVENALICSVLCVPTVNFTCLSLYNSYHCKALLSFGQALP